jgi:hypothetical protein
VTGLQPTIHGGAGWRLGEHVHLALGASAALQQPNQSEEDRIGAFFKLDGSAAWVF